MRCPRCGSLDTKRNGKSTATPVGASGPLKPLQRFLCRTCGLSFTSARTTAQRGASFSNDVMVEAVRLYVQGLPSYRTLATLLGRQLDRPISAMTLNRWVQNLSAAAMTPLGVSASLSPPGWGGVLGVDGKAIFVAGEERTLLVGVDQSTQDIVNAEVVETETEDAFERLVRQAVTVAGYPLQGLVIDAAQPFMAAHLNYFARLPLQLCRIHASRRLDFDIPKAKTSPDAPLRAELKDRARSALFAPDAATARHHLGALVDDRARFEGLGRRDTISAL